MIGRLVIAALLLVTGAGHGAEEIRRFVSEIQVHPDGAVEITETITVNAEGREIRRGIYRDFPTDYRDANNRLVRVTFDVVRTSRDGQTEPHHTERRGNGVRLYLGSADRFVEHGEHTYEIVYRSRGQLGYFDGFDEIYWNATGNGWIFPILEAEAVVRLPEPVPSESLHIAGYTGPQGSTERAYEATVPEPGVVRFRTTRKLGPQEGLTVAVGFPKGIVEPPAPPAPTQAKPQPASPSTYTDHYTWRWRLSRWVAWLGVPAVLAYYIFAWRRVGRDPKPGVIIPRYAPPAGMSPAALRYVKRMKYDATCMAAAIVNLAVKGALSIHQEGWFLFRSFHLRRVDHGDIELARGERVVYNALLGYDTEFEFSRKNHAAVQAAMRGQEAALKKEHRARSFRLNRHWVYGGVALSVLVVVGIVLLLGNPLMPVIWLALINLLFAWLMKAPTAQGRKVLDEIEGLRLYLGVAEKDTFANMDQPKTLEEFERLLPYAVALDCASTWVDRFEHVLEDLERTGELSRRNWMTGSGAISASSIASSVDSLASGFSSAISSSSSPPGSSSGSGGGGGGGGGSSGGGGGGGGGGGW